MFAPVALFTYNRPEHTAATLEALARNTLAAQSDLFIFSDGPKDESGVAAVEAVRKLVRNVTGFSSVTVIERAENMGLARSVIAGVTKLLDHRESVIVLEDDLVTSRLFLSYMNNALVHYRDDLSAFSVTGHTFPAKYLHIPPDYAFDTYAGYRCSSWSWGTWRDRWRRVDWQMSYFPVFCKDLQGQEEFNRGGSDMATLLRMQHEGKIDSWAIRFCYAHHANNMRCIYPTITLVRNIGLDNSGTHSKPELRFFHADLDETWLPKTFCPAAEINPEIAKNFRSVFDPPPSSSVDLVAPTPVPRMSRMLRSVGALAGEAGRLFGRSRRKVDILVVNTFQKNGGAARAAYRTFLGIKRARPDAHYLNLIKEDMRADISGHHQSSRKAERAQELASLDRLSLEQYPNRKMVTFTPALRANPMRIPLSRFDAKLVHLHWIAASMLRVEELGKLRVPVVWTLHDTWAFTGGCHYAGDCDRFKMQCGKCPQLGSSDENDLTRSVWKRKSEAFAKMDLTIVAPSRWMADLAKQSSLLSGRRVEVIPNGLDTEVFRPFDRGVAKRQFGADPDLPVLLFGAQWLSDRRKGGDLFCEAIAQLDFPCTLILFGEGTLPLPASDLIKVTRIGTLNDDAELARLYSASEVFVCPSREDNLPNTVAEALACGTPCAAFGINGLPDMIEHQKTGWLAKAFDPADLAAGIKWLAKHPNPSALREAARAKASRDYDLRIVAERYDRLYGELLDPARGSHHPKRVK